MLEDTKIVTMKDLEKSGRYSQELLKSLMSKDFEKLAELSPETRADVEYMEPLLYAVKNDPDLNTYEVYKYYAENLQDNQELAVEIIKTEPHLIENTPISRNENFIRNNVMTKPEIIRYMSPQLKANSKFVSQLINNSDNNIRCEIVKNCEISNLILNNPNLSQNIEFMYNAISYDVANLVFASEELKNNYEFIKEVCYGNKETITYISEHTEDFGNEGITAAKEVLVEETTTKSINDFEVELQAVNKELEENKDLDENRREQLETKRRQLTNNIKFINKIKEGKVNPERAIRLIDSICKNLGEEYRQELMKYIKMDDALVERKKEENKKTKGISLEIIEEKTAEATESGIREETGVIREEVTKEGERENGDTHDSRA